MLVEITKIPNAENSAIHLHPTDNVAIARVPLPAGAELRIDGLPLTTRDPIPAGHKVALWDIAEGETVERYGQVDRARQIADRRRAATYTPTIWPSRNSRSTTSSPPPICRFPVRAPTRPLSWAIRARTAAWARAITSPSSRPATARRTPPS